MQNLIGKMMGVMGQDPRDMLSDRQIHDVLQAPLRNLIMMALVN
jgi:hypothetical protein